MHESCVSYLVDTNIKKNTVFNKRSLDLWSELVFVAVVAIFFPGRVTFLENNAKFYVLPE